jgi:hypothetical protein
MSQAFQAFQQFCANFWRRFSSEWLPEILAKLLLFWQWLPANPIITLSISAVLLLWACLVIRKSTHDGWNFARIFLIFLLSACGFAGIFVVVHAV